GAVAHPGALLEGRVLDDVETDVLAVVLELVLDVALEGERLGLGEVDAAVLELVAVKDADRNEAAGLGMLLIAGPLKDRDGAELRGVARVGDLAGILCGSGKSEGQRGEACGQQ